MTSIEFAKMEAKGEGQFEIHGRTIVFVSNDRRMAQWACRDATEAKRHLKMFRASLKYAA